MQLVVTAYLVGFAVGQLFHGPLSDRFGRKPVLVAGLAVYALAAFACLVAGSFAVLLAARVVQGAANAAPRVVAVAVVRDVYGGRRMSEVMSFVMMVFIIVPVLAPTVGGLILLFGSWHLIFGFLFLFAAACIAWMWPRLPETRPPEAREPMSAAWLAAAVRETGTNRLTLGYTLAIGAIFGALMGYINSAQQIFVEVYRLGPWFPAGLRRRRGGDGGRLVHQQPAGRADRHAPGVARSAPRLRRGRAPPSRHRPRRRPAAARGSSSRCSPPACSASGSSCRTSTPSPWSRWAASPAPPRRSSARSPPALAAAIGAYVGLHYAGTVTPLLAGFAGCGLAGLAIVLVTERGRLFRVGS